MVLALMNDRLQVRRYTYCPTPNSQFQQSKMVQIETGDLHQKIYYQPDGLLVMYKSFV